MEVLGSSEYLRINLLLTNFYSMKLGNITLNIDIPYPSQDKN